MKTIRGFRDLAINGACPAFNEPVHVGRPNMGDREAFRKYVDDIFERCRLSNNGPLVQEFERRIAAYLGVKHCVAVCNGTVALEIAIRAVGLEGEVIIPSYTFIATAHALSWQAITPVFSDIDPNTHVLDPIAVRRMITPRTTGIIGVHLWGRAAPVEELQAIADEYGLKLMFDAAHAFGCTAGGQLIGRFGKCEVLSFHATKVLNTFEGGAIVTNDQELADAMRLMRNFGFAGFDDVIYPGTNGKMTEISAAMGLVNLDAIGQMIEANYRNYRAYCEALAGLRGIKILSPNRAERSNYQYVVVEVTEDFPVSRDQIIHVLHAENILARKYFWPGCHNMSPYRQLYPHAGLLLSNTQKVADAVIVLPTGTSVNFNQINTISKILRILSENVG